MIQAHSIMQSYNCDPKVMEFIEEHIGMAKDQSLVALTMKNFEIVEVEDESGIIEIVEPIEEYKGEHLKQYYKISAKEVILNNFRLTFH